MDILKILAKHKTLYAVTLIAVIAFTLLFYNFLDARPNPDVLTIGFVDAAAATLSSCRDVAKHFSPDARDAHVSRLNTDASVLAGTTPAQKLYEALINESADMLILDKDNLTLLAEEGYLAPVPEPSDPKLAISIDGICYGYLLDGADITGNQDMFIGYKGDKPENNQYFCAAVLEGCNNTEYALAAMAKLEGTLFNQMNPNAAPKE
jgi:hypothetical protein